jgi:hypothetical protein
MRKFSTFLIGAAGFLGMSLSLAADMEGIKIEAFLQQMLRQASKNLATKTQKQIL